MHMRKVPGFVPASPWGLRLPQKFLFLLFLSGLVTLCFGALFLLPHSSRLKRLFLASRTQQPGLEVMAEVAGQPPARDQESPPKPAPAAPAPGEDDPGSRTGPRRRKGWLRRTTRPTGPREEATPARGSSAAALKPGEESIPFSFDFNAFRSRLRHPVLGTRTDESKAPQSRVRAQREKIKEMMRFAWQNYRRYAMGRNELRPLTRDGYEGSMFGEWTGALPLEGRVGFHFQFCFTCRVEPCFSSPGGIFICAPLGSSCSPAFLAQGKPCASLQVPRCGYHLPLWSRETWECEQGW